MTSGIEKQSFAVRNEPPFLRLVQNILHEDRPDLSPATIAEKSHVFDPGHVRWQAVRHAHLTGPHAPTVPHLTGYEVYYDPNQRPDEIAQAIAGIGENQLRRLNPRLRRQVVKALNGEETTPTIAIELHTIQGAVVARLRAQAAINPSTVAIIEEERNQCANRSIEYATTGDAITHQQYAIPRVRIVGALQLPNHSFPYEPDTGYGFMHALGRITHPLIRQTLHSLDNATISHMRFRR